MHSTRDCEWAQWKTVRGTKGNGEKLRWRFLWTETKAEMHPPTQFSSYPFHFHSIASTTSLPLRTSRYLVTSRLYIWDNFYRRYRSFGVPYLSSIFNICAMLELKRYFFNLWGKKGISDSNITFKLL